MNKFILYLFILSLSSCSCCNRPDYCPEYDSGNLFIPYQNNSNVFVSENGDEYELFFNYEGNSSAEPDNRCLCYLDYRVNGIFSSNNQDYDVNISFLNNEARATEELISTNYINFEFANIEFNIDTGIASIEGATYLGEFNYNDTLELPHSNLFENQNGDISELIYSLDSGIVRFMLNDTIWYRKF